MAAAIGAGLPVAEANGNMIVDIGGGTTEVAVISLSGIVVARSVRVAGDEMDEAIIQHIKRTYNLMIGERTSENIKISVGSAYKVPPPDGESDAHSIKGRDLVTGLPKSVTITANEVRECLEEPISAIVEAVKVTLEETPPELAADIMERGIVMAGGGSLLRGLDRLLSEETGLPVFLADDPTTCVVMGTGRAVDELDRLSGVLSSDDQS